MDAVVGVGGNGAIADQVVLDTRRFHQGCAIVPPILALSCGFGGSMDDLDFSQPAKKPEPPKPAAQPQAAAPAPVYNPAIARDFFASAGKEEQVAAGTKIFTENEKASRILLKRDKMYLLLEGQVGLTAKGKPVGSVKLGEIFGEMAAIAE